jgi:hypothetical protein
MFALVIPLLSCLGERIAPILPRVIDMICDNWDKLDISVILKTVQWIAVHAPHCRAFHEVDRDASS